MWSDVSLFLSVVICWACIWLLLHRKTSLVPVIPIVPFVLFLIGIALNDYVWRWLGTILITVLQIIPFLVELCFWVRTRERRGYK